MNVIMNEELEAKDSEIKELKSKLDKVNKENENLKKFNEDLRGQIKLLTGKLDLFKQLNNTINPSQPSASVEKPVESSAKPSSTLPNSKAKSERNDWMEESKNKKMKITDLVTSIAQQNVSLNDYIYDQHSKTYYSKSTGWFYYEDRNLFYDPNSKNYYSYNRDKNTMLFHSTLEDVLKQTKELKKKEAKPSKDGDCEDGEILSSGEESDSSVREVERAGKCDAKEDEDEEDGIAPCIRLIVQQADSLDLGSLLLITVTGASLGKSSDCDLQLDEESVDERHAKVTFEERSYFIEDLASSSGVFINDKQIEPNRSTRIKHDDIVRLGEVEFLSHIHDKNNSCVYCEPGCVQAKLKSLLSQGVASVAEVPMSKEEKEKLRKSELKKIMKKYGINKYAKEPAAELAGDYNDRAAERRKQKGLSSENFKIERASLDKPIEESNKGFKLLEKWGWQKDDEKDTKLIETKANSERKGLGYS